MSKETQDILFGWFHGIVVGVCLTQILYAVFS